MEEIVVTNGLASPHKANNQGVPILQMKGVGYAITKVKKNGILRYENEMQVLLKNITGTINQGDFVAILGPSGAGKSTLMDVIADRKTTGSLYGSIEVNGMQRTKKFKSMTSYVQQENALIPSETVREAVMFHADLRLPASLTPAEKSDRVMQALKETGLLHRVDAKIGGVLPGGLSVPGLSGGEKRRVSIACALVTSPTILCLDEPTSGLDSTISKQVMEELLKMTQGEQKKTVVCVIHQPRTEIYNLFTKIIMVVDGHLLYWGNSPIEYLESLGYPCPPRANPADFIMDTLKVIKEEGKVQIVAEKWANTSFFMQAEVQAVNTSQVDIDKSESEFIVSYWHQFKILMKRFGREFVRNPTYSMARVSVALMFGLMLCSVFYKLGDGYKGTVSKLGALYICLNAVHLFPFSSISMFLAYRHNFNLENAAKIYHPFPYFIAFMIFEAAIQALAILGLCLVIYWTLAFRSGAEAFFYFLGMFVLQGIVGNLMIVLLTNLTTRSDLAFSAGAGVVTLELIYSGFLVPVKHIPIAFSWIRWIQPMYYGFKGLVKNEFEGVTLACDPGEPCIFPVGDIVVDLYSSLSSSLGEQIGITILWVFALFFLAYLCIAYLHKEKR